MAAAAAVIPAAKATAAAAAAAARLRWLWRWQSWPFGWLQSRSPLQLLALSAYLVALTW